MKTTVALTAAALAACTMHITSAQMELEGDIVVVDGIDSPDVEQPPLPGTTETITYHAEGQFATAAGVSTCTFNDGDFLNDPDTDGIPNNSWFIRTQSNSGGIGVEGCQPLDQSSGLARNRLPRNSKKIPAGGLSGDGDVANKDAWGFIGAVNSGGRQRRPPRPNYNAAQRPPATNNLQLGGPYCTETPPFKEVGPNTGVRLSLF